MNTRFLIISILALITITSCASRKNIVYFQDEALEEGQLTNEPIQLTYKPDDILTINVSALDPDTVRPFNLPTVSNNTSDLITAQNSTKQQTYLVDYNGNIEFPVLGTIKVEGLTRTELTKLLTDRIKVMVNDPIINIRLANFTITVIGEVARPGTFTIQDESITLLEALGHANDLTIFGKRKNVLLIREIDGVKKFAKIDLTSINTVNSDFYYMQQNDVIYVEPNKAKIRSSTYNQNNGVLISAIGTLTTIIAVFIVK
ncbi:polysaccharide biosynthesis/export family protein [Winogradskyella bathintestinalis]|uniref:Polysaccharide biosynthesis/export family protein n=1 Tax=Winogradskyella bathintestinalis TaxID=3035208 RepID=A0ABT7ZXK0_9FLAO|nr:polysaccharide biosynthesis/export family protein [Winogradskyella bathintestinalis]MDN3493731.1 polysaccharide biosynthesis/export family protein [Winogradskyella bathintestinalis]